MDDERPRLIPFESEYFARCLKSLLEHLGALRPLLGETHLSDQSIATARHLVQSFVLKETGPNSWDRIFRCDGSKTDDVEANRASLKEKTLGAFRVSVFRDDTVADWMSPPAYAAMKKLLEVLFQFSRDWLAPTEIRRLAHELRDHAAIFVEHKTGMPWAPMIPNEVWIHDASESPPAEYASWGPLTGTKTQLGFAVREPSRPVPNQDKQLRQDLTRAAQAKNPRIWLRWSMTAKQLDCFFRKPEWLHQAQEQIKEFARRKSEHADGSVR